MNDLKQMAWSAQSIETRTVTVGALDNCDHNPTSATAQDSFHGTSISLFQFPSEDNPGTERSATSIEHERSAKLKPLPDDYAQVPPAILCTKTVFLLESDGPVTPYERTLPVALAEEKQWLAHVKELLDKDNLDKEDYVTWSAYHASCQPQIPHTVCFNSLLPLFYESAHTVAMIKHGMTVIKQATHFVNPGQTVVMAVDQPLYALAKQVQLAWPDTHGEDKYLIMFGGLHIEMAVLRALGTWLEDSGWTAALVQADVSTSGTADSYIKATHVTKSRHAHQVTAASLSILKTGRFKHTPSLCLKVTTNLILMHWEKESADKFPQFKYWILTLNLQILLLVFVRAQRDGNFDLYLETLNKLAPWFFALHLST